LEDAHDQARACAEQRDRSTRDPESGFSRRRFLVNSGLAGVTGLTAAATLSSNRITAQAPAWPQSVDPTAKRVKTICPFCSVGCAMWAEVQDGVWIGQEPVFESPINMGTHCAKGAATRELGHGERRLKYPTKLVNGQWTRISWDEAIAEIGDKVLKICAESGPDSVFWCGSSKFSNEAAYLHRKYMAMWGSNNATIRPGSATPRPSPASPAHSAMAR
jgi:formate dehydrogenase major subunit